MGEVAVAVQGGARCILVVNDALKSALLGIHQFCEGLSSSICIWHQVDTIDSSSEVTIEVQLKPMN